MKIFKQKSENKEKLLLLKSCLGDLKKIENVNHCSTRIRIKVLNIDEINLEKIKEIDFIQNALVNENMVHLLINKNIEKINIEFLGILGIDVSKVANLFDVKINQKKKIMQTIFDGISLIIGPIIPFLITLALVSTITNVIAMIDTDNVVYKMFKVLQKELVLGFSIIIHWSIFKMMGGSESIGLAIGIVLCSKELLSSLNFLSGNSELFHWTEFEGDSLSFSDIASGYPWKISYDGQILPIVAIVFLQFILKD
ncbi:hypothetical protein [Spiroplasma taiwanense]|uniref:hypothetical protein n=1 Tax=Spiroplasma taiwanense TaxID=2145 RepID=UPI00041BAF4B|nr:hypothetical protein [Spiroplasma taiwanense]